MKGVEKHMSIETIHVNISIHIYLSTNASFWGDKVNNTLSTQVLLKQVNLEAKGGW